MPRTLCQLLPGDEACLDAFLARHANTTMFLRSNLRRAGLIDGGARYEATWMATRDARGELLGVAAHAWNGMVLIQTDADVDVTDMVRAAVAVSGRNVAGAAGPLAQVDGTLAALGLGDAPTALTSRDVLMSLDLADLRVPEPLAQGAWRCRPADAEDLAVLVPWRRAYFVEAMAMGPDSAEARGTPDLLARAIDDAELFVLCDAAGELLAMSAFNARVPGMVQIGGVYTPPEQRSRGYGRAVVAGSLQQVAPAGVTRSVLFTPEDNHPAQAAYDRIGYTRCGFYGLVILKAS